MPNTSIAPLRANVERHEEGHFRVGDIVTRDGTDRQRVLSVDKDYFCIEVECIKEPTGFLNDDGTRGPPWCKLGDREHNLSRRYDLAGDIIEDGTNA